MVLMPHDKMISQANDATTKSWVMCNEHHLRKKGVGQGLHMSVCRSSTSGWLDEGCEILEYGKVHGGFWTGELFVKQVRLSELQNQCLNLITLSFACSSRRKSFQLLRQSMVLVIKHCFTLTICKATLHMVKMPY